MSDFTKGILYVPDTQEESFSKNNRPFLQVSNTASVKLKIEFLISPNTVLWFFAKHFHRLNLLNPKNNVISLYLYTVCQDRPNKFVPSS